jgi:hypothetical protein
MAAASRLSGDLILSEDFYIRNIWESLKMKHCEIKTTKAVDFVGK